MNCMNSRIPDKTNTTLSDPPNNQNLEMKNNWNKVNIAKEEVVEEEPETIDLPDSPKIESFVETIDVQHAPLKAIRSNGFYPKRMKIGHEEYEANDQHFHGIQDTQDDCDTYGRYVAAQLRQMSKMQKVIAQRLVSEICFRGQINALQLNTAFNNSTSVFQQQAQPMAVYNPRPVPFGRGQDYLMVHQQGMRHQAHISGNVTAVGPSCQYQNFVSLPQQQQPEQHAPNPMNHMSGMGQADNMP